MNTGDLNLRDVEMLLEAIDAWTIAPVSDGLSEMMFGAMTGVHKGEAKETLLFKLKEDQKKMNVLRLQRKEDAVFLSAKLLQLRNRLRECAPVPDTPA